MQIERSRTSALCWKTAKMSLLTLKSGVVKLASIRAPRDQHVVVVFNGTPEADEQAEKLVAQG